MPYNPKTQATLVIDKPYHKMLKELAAKRGQSLRRGLELLIEKEYQADKED